MGNVTWEERMSAKHRPVHFSDPVPMIPAPPSDLCQECSEWRGRWVRENKESDWEPQYYWAYACDPDCDHTHHGDEVMMASAGSPYQLWSLRWSAAG